MFKKVMLLFFVMSSVAFAQSEVITTDSTSRSTVNSTTNSINETTVKSPPPSAISPSMNILNNDVCTTGVSGAVQTQILGISAGSTVRDLNCERLKLSRTLYDAGLKVAAVSLLCQDERVFKAMQMAGTPCPIDGKIGAEAHSIWNDNPDRHPGISNESNSSNSAWKIGGIILFFLLLL